MRCSPEGQLLCIQYTEPQTTSVTTPQAMPSSSWIWRSSMCGRQSAGTQRQQAILRSTYSCQAACLGTDLLLCHFLSLSSLANLAFRACFPWLPVGVHLAVLCLCVDNSPQLQVLPASTEPWRGLRIASRLMACFLAVRSFWDRGGVLRAPQVEV